MAIYYYYGTGDWSQTSNWWLNASHTTPANSLPSPTDSVVLLSNIDDTGSALTVSSLSAKGNIYVSATINADCYFYDNSYLVPNGVEGYDMYGQYFTYTAGGVINNDTFTTTIKYKVYFYNNSFCAGVINSCTVYFYNNSYISSGTPTSNIDLGNFAGSINSYNASLSAYFYDNSYNAGAISIAANGNPLYCFFYNNSYNSGNIYSNNGPININIYSSNFNLGNLQFYNNQSSKIIFGTQVSSRTLTISGNQNFASTNDFGDPAFRRYGDIYDTSNQLITAFVFKDNSINNYQTFNLQSTSATNLKFYNNSVNNTLIYNGEFSDNSYTTNNILNICTLNTYASSFFYKSSPLTINTLKLNYISTDNVTVSGNFIVNTNLTNIVNSNNQNIQIKLTDTATLSGSTLGTSITSSFFNSTSSINCIINGISYYYNNSVNLNFRNFNFNYYYDNSINNSVGLFNVYTNNSTGNTTSKTALTSIYFDNSTHLGYSKYTIFNDRSYNGSGGQANTIIHNNLKQKGIYDSNILSMPSRIKYNLNDSILTKYNRTGLVAAWNFANDYQLATADRTYDLYPSPYGYTSYNFITDDIIPAIQFTNFGTCGRFSGLRNDNNPWNLRSGDNASFSAWIKLSQDITFTGGCGYAFFGSAFDSQFGFYMNFVLNQKNLVRYGLAGTTSFNDPLGALIVGQWYHIVGTWNAATKTFSIYRNGVLAQSSSNINITGTTSTGFCIDGSGAYGGEYGVPIIFGPTGLWKATLTQNDVTALYNNGNGLLF